MICITEGEGLGPSRVSISTIHSALAASRGARLRAMERQATREGSSQALAPHDLGERCPSWREAVPVALM